MGESQAGTILSPNLQTPALGSFHPLSTCPQLNG